jgi:hypothetical protein
MSIEDFLIKFCPSKEHIQMDYTSENSTCYGMLVGRKWQGDVNT